MFSSISTKRRFHPAAPHREDKFRDFNLDQSNLSFRVERSAGDRAMLDNRTFETVAEDLFQTEMRRSNQVLPKQVLYSYRAFRPRRDLIRPMGVESP